MVGIVSMVKIEINASSLVGAVCLSNKMSIDSVPKELRGLRACKLCSMVKVRNYILTSVGTVCFLFSHSNNFYIKGVTIVRGSYI